jgi:hypothetical protein
MDRRRSGHLPLKRRVFFHIDDSYWLWLSGEGAAYGLQNFTLPG